MLQMLSIDMSKMRSVLRMLCCTKSNSIKFSDVYFYVLPHCSQKMIWESGTNNFTDFRRLVTDRMVNGASLLETSILRHQKSIAIALIKNGVDLEPKRDVRNFPIVVACMTFDGFDILRCLLEHGACATHVYQHCGRSFNLAHVVGWTSAHSHFVSLLADHGVRTDLCVRNSKKGDVEVPFDPMFRSFNEVGKALIDNYFEGDEMHSVLLKSNRRIAYRLKIAQFLTTASIVFDVFKDQSVYNPVFSIAKRTA